MIKKVKHHIKKIRYFWKDNKVVMLKHIYSIFVCGINKFPARLKRAREEEKIEKIIKGKEEIVKELAYSPTLKSRIILPTEDEGLTRDLLLHPIREPTEINLFMKEVGGHMNIVDIGANLGLYLLLEPRLTKGKVYGIEPNPMAFEFLKKSVKLNGFKNVKLLNMGISNKKDNIPFYISRKWNWCRFTEGGEDIVKVKKIKVNSLDNLFKKQKIDVLRMDVEGYEIQILNGSINLIKNNPTIKIFMEYHANMFTTSERIKFANWLKEHRLRIKYLIKSNKYKVVKIKKDVPLNVLRNMNTDYCLVLERY